MKLFDSLREKETGRLSANTMVPFRMTYGEAETGKPGSSGYFSKEYALTLTLSQIFSANTVQLSEARKAAVNAMAMHMFAEIHKELAILTSAICAGSVEDSFRSIDRIRDWITP